MGAVETAGGAKAVRVLWRAVAGAPTRRVRDAFLKDVLGEARFDRIAKTANGKPYILPNEDDAEPPCFSLTHTRGLLLAVVTDAPIGLDAEADTRAVSPLLKRRILSETERAVYEALPDGERNAYLLLRWVAKEAHLKLTGDGVSGGMAQLTLTADGRIEDETGSTLSFLAAERTAGYLVVAASASPIALSWS